MPTRADALAVMAKAPIPGSVKTRLVPPLTFEQAAELAQALLIDQIEHLAEIGGAELYLAFAPEAAGAIVESLLPAGFSNFAQRGHDLGARMENCIAELQSRGHRNVLLIGGDLPPVPVPFFSQAFEFLSADERRVVLGPSRDGGFYLVGMNMPPARIFSGMTWSHNGVLRQTIEQLARLKIDYALLPQWFDIDTAEDLDALRTVSDPALLRAMKRTRAFLNRLAPGGFAGKTG